VGPVCAADTGWVRAVHPLDTAGTGWDCRKLLCLCCWLWQQATRALGFSVGTRAQAARAASGTLSTVHLGWHAFRAACICCFGIRLKLPVLLLGRPCASVCSRG
jgi:hypothetical protein